MAKAAAKNEEREGFTLREMIEYETLFKEPLSDITKDDRPRMKKIAYLGFIKKRREDKDLTFDKYLDAGISADQAVVDAFGEQEEATEE